MLTASLALAAALSSGLDADAQGLMKDIGKRAKNATEQRVKTAADRAVQGTLDKAENAVEQSTKAAAAQSQQGAAFGKAENAATSGNAAAAAASGEIFYVSRSGNNRSDGKTPQTAVKNIQKAIDIAPEGSEIRVAEGNYYGLLNVGYIVIDKPISILGGYNSDFTERDILKYKTTIQPDVATNGTIEGRGVIQLKSIVRPGARLLIDGLILDKGYTIGYSLKGEGWPEGVETPMMINEGSKGQGGPDLSNKEVYTKETYFIYFNGDQGKVNTLDVTVRNCTFVNGPNTAICGLLKGSLTVENNVFVNVRTTTMDVRGADPQAMTQVNFRNNTVLFVWSYKKDLASQGFGFRFQPGTCCDIENNIIGLTIFAGLDRTHIDSDKSREAKRHDVVRNNIFFLNRVTDLTIPGGGMLTRVKVEDFDDVEALAEVGGNKSLSDPQLFKGRIDEAYLAAFLNVSYSESTDYNPNSAANTFRQAMGMNMVGTMQSSVSMYANRYPWAKALDVFGAVEGYGAQLPK